ncbi:MAG: hypothetical protein HYX57_07575 [Chloroflexi bacterium]|nr:hypothetical protein [Chloroflexota bacterium]
MATVARPETPRQLRLMPYGRTSTRQVRDGIWEPLWGGRRALVEVMGRHVSFRDEHDVTLDGFDNLREAIVDCARAEELVLDGYLLPAPLRDSSDAESPIGLDAAMTAGQVGKQMLLGGGIGNEHRDELAAASARRVRLHATSPTAFVAVDLLWLDGEPLVDLPLQERKRLLESVLLDHELVRRTMAVRPPVETWFAQWRALGFREMAVKGANSRYTPGHPNGEWAISMIPRR